MTEQLNIIFEFVESLRPDIVKNQLDKGLRASGKSALSLKTITVGEKITQLVDGSGAFKFQDSPGRGPTKSSGPTPLHSIIYDWLAYKKYGLTYDNDKQRMRLSFAIANKIHKKGTYIHITGKKTGVVTELITDNRLLLLRERISKFYVRKTVTGYMQAFGKN